MADESKWWPQIMGHVLRYGAGAKKEIDRSLIGHLLFCTNGAQTFLYRVYYKPVIDKMGKHIYKGNDLEKCRDAIAEYFRTREMFPVDQNQERTSA